MLNIIFYENEETSTLIALCVSKFIVEFNCLLDRFEINIFSRV